MRLRRCWKCGGRSKHMSAIPGICAGCCPVFSGVASIPEAALLEGQSTIPSPLLSLLTGPPFMYHRNREDGGEDGRETEDDADKLE